MLLTVEHVTTYRYEAPVRGVVQSHRLTPAQFEGQKVLAWEVQVTDGLRGGGFRDGSGDWIQGWTVRGPVSEIAVTVRGTVETQDTAGVLRGLREVTAPPVWLTETAATAPDDAIIALAGAAQAAGDTLAVAHEMSDTVAEAIAWTRGATRAHTSAAEALALGEGVCQDHAHVLIAMARSGGLPARYVTGYFLTGEDDGEAAHAWAEIWIKGLGWVGFDPANRCCPDDRYIRLGCGFDAQDAAPIRGTTRGPGSESLTVAVAVRQAQMQSQRQQ